MRLAAQAKGGFYPTPIRVIELILQLITPQRASLGRGSAPQTLRLLDPCCGAGEALSLVARALNRRTSLDVESFGVELHQERSSLAQQALDHALAADIFRCSIANRAFSLLWLNPPYDYDSEDQRTEHAFLTQCSRYLAPDGLLVYIVPRKRLRVSARYLASHYSRLSCWAFPEQEREAFDQVVVIGERKHDTFTDTYTENLIGRWSDGELESLDEVRYSEFNLRAETVGDVLFTTRTIDPVAAATEARRSGLWQSPQITDALWPQEDARTRPLMPLRRGHLAMLVAAGFLDNLELEAGGSRILVKGRTAKELILVEETPDKEVYRERMRTTVVALDLQTGEISDIDA